MIAKTYVYLADGGAFIKIGLSRTPHGRMRSLLTSGSSIPHGVTSPRLIHAVEATLDDERILHAAIQAHRVVGEWYRPRCLRSRALIKFFKSRPQFQDEPRMAGARIDAPLWREFAAVAKQRGKSVADALEDALRAALNGKPVAQGAGPRAAAGRKGK